MRYENPLAKSSQVSKPPAKKPENQNKQLEEQEPFAAEIAKRVAAVVGKDKASVVTAQVVALFSERFSGPIAHPKHLREYEEILPGAADRIISMAERSMQHTQDAENKIIQAEINDTRDGRRYGFMALMALVAAALVAGYMGLSTLALTFVGAGALGTIGAFIKGRMSGNGTP